MSHTPTRPHFRSSLGKGALWAGSVSQRPLAQPNVSDSIIYFVKRHKTYLWLLGIHKSFIPWTLEREPTALPASPTNDLHLPVPFPVLVAPHLPRCWRRLTDPALGSDSERGKRLCLLLGWSTVAGSTAPASEARASAAGRRLGLSPAREVRGAGAGRHGRAGGPAPPTTTCIAVQAQTRRRPAPPATCTVVQAQTRRTRAPIEVQSSF